jgi:hypothetical protein
MLVENFEIEAPSTALGKLQQRLEAGWEIIAEREAAGQPVDDLNEHWLLLLEAYEQACDLSGLG